MYLWLRPTCNTRSYDKYVPLQHVGVSLNREMDTILIIKFFIIQFFKIPYRAPPKWLKTKEKSDEKIKHNAKLLKPKYSESHH